jgi:hypothetical protein
MTRTAKHLSVNAGYQLGSRLVVNNSPRSNRIGLRLTQSGAIVGARRRSKLRHCIG